MNDCEAAEIKSTPWGKPIFQREIAPGLIDIHTNSHGGVWMSPGRVELFKMMLPDFKPCAGYPWLEEDCDILAAIILWPGYFDPFSVRNAVCHYQMARFDRNGVAVNRFLNLHVQGQSVVRQAQDWAKAHGDEWMTGTMTSHGHGWLVWFSRISDGLEQIREVPDYPAKPLYTAGELEAFKLHVIPSAAPTLAPRGWASVEA